MCLHVVLKGGFLLFSCIAPEKLTSLTEIYFMENDSSDGTDTVELRTARTLIRSKISN